jgi:hypothetical protein
MAMMDWVHMWFRPFRDELSLRRDHGRAAQNGKGTFRRKFGETPRRRMPTIHARNYRPQVLASLAPVLGTVALGRQTHYTMIQAHLKLAVREALPLVPFKEPRASAAARSRWVASTA